MRNFLTSIGLLFTLVLLVCGIYPIIIWGVGQTLFSFQANGSLLKSANGQALGSRLLAQDFKKAEHFHPRPSAASYDAANSAASYLAPSNYKLRNRVAKFLGPIAQYYDGKLVGPDIETWFARDKFNGKSGLVAQWVTTYPTVAKDWVNSNPAHSAYISSWAKQHPKQIENFTSNMQILVPTVDDLTGLFFNAFSKQYPGKFPRIVSTQSADGGVQMEMQPVSSGVAIQEIFFDMWRQEHNDTRLKFVQGDMVTTSCSGLDPHITLKNAMQQLDRVAPAWAGKLQQNDKKYDVVTLRQEIRSILVKLSFAPMAGLAGEDLINVLEINLALHQRFDVHA